MGDRFGEWGQGRCERRSGEVKVFVKIQNKKGGGVGSGGGVGFVVGVRVVVNEELKLL